MAILRSIAFQIVFYIVFAICAVLALPMLLLTSRGAWKIVQLWSRVLRATCAAFGMKIEMRGLENLPATGCIVAIKHQSALETIGILEYFPYPAFIMKRELMWLPLFGWYAAKSRMVPINRARRSEALKALTVSCRQAVSEGRQIVIFPEGTRRPVGAEPHYKYGIAHLYRELGVPVVPVALNTGLFWPRNTLWRYPGTAILEVLPEIPPGLTTDAFFAALVDTIETASDRLLLEAVARPDSPPLTDMAARHVASLTKT